MNVRCPSCQTVFRVDPERVPAAGIKARCAKCAAVFQLNKSGVVAAAQPAAQAITEVRTGPPLPPPAPEPPAVPPPAMRTQPPPPTREPEVLPREQQPLPTPAVPPSPGAPVVVPPAPLPMPPQAPVAPAAGKRPSFRNQDPQSRAQRIARALVSDIVAYNKSKLKEQMDAAHLRTEFREEIRKSWEEYVEQVGLDMAKSTPYFRDSLNEILAKGQKVF